MLRDMTMFRYTDSDPEMTYKNYHWARLNLFQRMQFRGLTERKVCQQVCHLLEHDGFCKPRRENHAGIMRLQVFCIRCSCPARFRPTGVRWDVVLGAPWVESPKPFRADPTPQMFFHQRSEANRALVVCWVGRQGGGVYFMELGWGALGSKIMVVQDGSFQNIVNGVIVVVVI